jgi:MucB/RseB N-terminal domain
MVAGGSVPATEDILAHVSAATSRHHSVEYAGQRRYALKNLRFGKSADLTVDVRFHPRHGKTFTIVNRSGSEKLISIMEKLLASEAESSRPAMWARHDIGPQNYHARLRGVETVNGRSCYVLDLAPKSRSKYLISGTVWVDRETYGLVRLDGTTSASVSFWVGSPHIVQNFAPVQGVWLPQHATSISQSALLGQSELEIQYSDYRIARP